MQHFRVLSAPSCSAKGFLRPATLEYLRKHHPDIKVAELILCVSRFPRKKKGTDLYEVHGVDHYFLPRGLFVQLDLEHFIVGPVRQHLQAIDMNQVAFLLGQNDLIIAEVFHTLGNGLMEWVKRHGQAALSIKSAFLMPLSDAEIDNECRRRQITPKDLLEEIVRERLERRGEDSPTEIDDRVSTVWAEAQSARNYSRVIVNHAGEDNREEWTKPLGPEASRVLAEFVEFLLEP